MKIMSTDVLEVHSGLRLLDRAADNAYCQNYPGDNHAVELQEEVSTFGRVYVPCIYLYAR